MKAAYKRIRDADLIQADILNTDGQAHKASLEEQGFAQTEATLAVAQSVIELQGELEGIRQAIATLR